MQTLDVETSESFEQGLQFLASHDYSPASLCFERLLSESGKSVYRNRFLSFWGIAQVLSGDISGLNVCRGAADNEFYDADVYYNLAIAEFKARNRGRGFAAINQGLMIDNTHSGLRMLFRRMDRRRSPVLGFLARENPLNVCCGKLYKKVKGRPTLRERMKLDQLEYYR